MKILGHDYKLKYSTLAEMDPFVGQCHFDRKDITVARDVPYKTIQATLVHEIIEAINYHLELEMNHKQITGMEVGMFQALVDNGVDLSVLYSKTEENHDG